MAREDLELVWALQGAGSKAFQGCQKQAGRTNRKGQTLQSSSRIGAKPSTVLKQEIKYQGTAR